MVVDGVAHGAAFELLAGFVVPEDFAVSGVGGDYGAVGVAVEDKAAGGGHEAAVERAAADVGDFPGDLAGLDVESAEKFFRGVAGALALGALVEGFAEGEGFFVLHEDVAVLGGKDEKLSRWAGRKRRRASWWRRRLRGRRVCLLLWGRDRL